MSSPSGESRGRGARGAPIALWLLLALTVATIGLGAWRVRAGQQRVAEQSVASLTGQPKARAADFTLLTPGGEAVRLADLRGKVVLLNFWATWCPPCKAEMPDMQSLHEQYGGAQGLVILGIDFQEDAATVDAFVREHGLTFPIVLDPTGEVTQDLYHVRPLPTSMIFDREGVIRDVWNGHIVKAAMLARLQRVW